MKIPISISPFFWVFALLLGFLSAPSFQGVLIWVVVVFLSVLVHELGHALAGLLFRQKVSIEIAFFGGMTSRQGSRLSLWKEFCVVIAGPLAGFGLFLIAYLAISFVPPESLIFYGIKVAMLVNLVWTVLNIVPVLPLDGGKLFSLLAEAVFGWRGYKIALWTSFAFAFFIGMLAMVLGQVFVGVVFFLLCFENFRTLRYAPVFSDKDRDGDLQQLFEKGIELFEAGDKDGASQVLQQLCQKTQRGMLFAQASEILAQIYDERGEEKEAWLCLQRVERLSDASMVLYHKLAFSMKDYEKVYKLAGEVFQLDASCETALKNAMACAAMQDPQASVGWLERALQEGISDIQQILADPIFDPIRKHPLFVHFASEWS